MNSRRSAKSARQASVPAALAGLAKRRGGLPLVAGALLAIPLLAATLLALRPPALAAQHGVPQGEGSAPAGLPPVPFALTPDARAEAFEDSVRLYGRQARAGETRAQYLFGYLYENGLGVEQDFAAAAEWYGKAAASGSRDAQFRLGTLYLNGQGVARDLPRAAELFRAAAEQGLGAAQLNLAIILESGAAGPEADLAAAARWYRAAALQGNAEAQNNLGLLYVTGQGLPRDVAEGLRWLQLAARQGSADGLLNLARMNADGIGVERDLVKAYALLLRVQPDASPAETAALAARVREAMAVSLSAAELAEAERLAADPGLLIGAQAGPVAGDKP